MPCGCGRSPTGECIGWHALSEEEYQQELAQWKADNGESEGSKSREKAGCPLFYRRMVSLI